MNASIDFSLHAQWTAFAAAVVPQDASPDQRGDMLMAFYAGATAHQMLQSTLSAVLEEPIALHVMNALHAEVEAFQRFVRLGKGRGADVLRLYSAANS